MPDFAFAAKCLPTLVARTHRGREPDDGFDCLGLVLWLYREAGVPIGHLDIPYAERDQSSPRMWDRIRKLAEGSLAECTEETKSRRDQDGDIWLFKDVSGGISVGVFIDRELLVMYDSLRRQDADSQRVHVKQSFRLN